MFFKYEKTATRFLFHVFGKKILSIRRNQMADVIKNQNNQLARLKKEFGKRKLRVGFLVSERAKWQYQSVYHELEDSSFFEPVILVTELESVHKCKSANFDNVEICFDFFNNMGMRTEYAYDIRNKKFLSLSDFNIDILFYQQPWELDDLHHPTTVSAYALTCYMCYGLLLVNFNGMYTEDFHRYIWKMFVEHTSLVENFEKLIKTPITNCEPIGYLKLDEYFNLSDSVENSNKKIVIYAPHHSLEKNSLNIATFRETGRAMLAFAEKHKDSIYWIFKPHPRFKYAVLHNNVMKQDELYRYYEAWERLGAVHDSGNYFELFKQSAAMITDSCSFLGEYLPSGHPIFQFEKNPGIFNSLGQSLISSYYRVKNVDELEEEFVRVVLKQDDYLRETRLSKIPMIFDSKSKSSTKVLNSLITELQTDQT